MQSASARQPDRDPPAQVERGLLPWFGLALPKLGRLTPFRMFVLFEIADVSVFVSRFSWFGVYDGGSIGGLFGGFFEIALLARAAVLVACLVAYLRNRVPAPEELAAQMQLDRGDDEPPAEGAEETEESVA